MTSPKKDQMPRETQKKTDMPPPPRPGRSASVRQPATTSSTPASAGGHARHRSQLATPVASQPKIEPSTNVSRPKAQFSTYQQHYSPRKPTKPPTPTPDPDRSLIPSTWPEIAALQTELLQLNLLHSSSVQRDVEWQATAEAGLRRKYESVAKTYKSILAEEKEYQRRLNGQALGLWSKNSEERSDRQGFPEQIQLLSQVAQEVFSLSDNAGRYTLVIRAFEDWFQNVEDIRKLRNQSDEESITDPVALIDPLDHAWKEELRDLTMKIELCSRQLQSLDILGYGEIESLEGSGLLRIAIGLRDMTDMMIKEIKAIRSIEADIVKSERSWVSQIAGRLAAQPRTENVPRVGVWKRGKP